MSGIAVYLPLVRAYDEIVRLAMPKLRQYGTVSLSVITLIALIFRPLPFCVDCGFPNPWGHVAKGGQSLVFVWLFAAPFLAGVFALRRGWLVPICVVVALLLSQPLGGVAWWSLRDNEGPVILMFGFPATFMCFGLGYVVRVLAGFPLPGDSRGYATQMDLQVPVTPCFAHNGREPAPRC